MKKCSFILLITSLYAESSVIDSAYKNKTLQSANVTQKIYSQVFKSGYSTDCMMTPTDSQYVAQVSQKCGMTKALVKGIARFFNEPDSGFLGLKVISGFEKVSYEDFSTNCDIDN